MKKIVLYLLFAALPVLAQVSNPSVQYVSVAPSGACSASPPVQVVISTGALYTCNNGTWGTSGGGALPAGCTSSGTGILTCSGAVTGNPILSGTPSGGATAALPAGSHGMACDETSTTGVPATGVDYLRCDSVTHQIVASLNDGAEAPLGGGAVTNITGAVTISGCTVSGGKCVVGTPGTTIAVSSIPGTYTHLRVMIMGGSSNNAVTPLYTRLNGDSGSSYISQDMYATGAGVTTASGYSAGAATAMQVCELQGTGASPYPGTCEEIFPYYALTTFNKTVSSVGTGYATGAAAAVIETEYGAWNSNAAITSITFGMATGNFVAGSAISIYGVN